MKQRLAAWIEWYEEHPDQFQFGQRNDVSTYNGSTGCTHEFVQSMHLAIHGIFLTHDEISKLCGYPWPENNPFMRGMRASTDPSEELNTCIRKLNLPFVIRFYQRMTDGLYTALCVMSNDGPMGVAVNYPYIPRNKSKAIGALNGTAEVGGATQTGLVGGHLATWIGYDKRTDAHPASSKPIARWHHWWHDPDHGSMSRPERPAWDRYTATQGKALIESIHTVRIAGASRHIMVIAPTRPLMPKAA